MKKLHKYIFELIENKGTILYMIILLAVVRFPYYVYILIEGTLSVSRWEIGILFFLFLIFTYSKIYKIFNNIGYFFSLLFIAIWLIPTIEYKLYENNPENYRFTEDFKNSVSSLAKEKIKGELKLSELNYIKIEMNKVIKKALISDTNKQYPSEEIYKMCNSYHKDTILIPEPIKLKFNRLFSILDAKYNLELIKNDSTKTTLFIKTEIIPTDYEIIKSLEYEIQKQNHISNLISGIYKIPYSQFLVESITCFNSNDISPTRNLPKVLNALHILIILCITTIFINLSTNSIFISRKIKEE